MYPVFPPALNACVDLAHTEHLDMPAAPHALVLPAPFPPCAKIVQARAEAHSSGADLNCARCRQPVATAAVRGVGVLLTAVAWCRWEDGLH